MLWYVSVRFARDFQSFYTCDFRDLIARSSASEKGSRSSDAVIRVSSEHENRNLDMYRRRSRKADGCDDGGVSGEERRVGGAGGEGGGDEPLP